MAGLQEQFADLLHARDSAIQQVKDKCGQKVNGEAVLFAASATGEPAFKEAAGRMLYYLLEKAPRTRDGTLHQILMEAAYQDLF